jgi:phosphoribosylanthranilate isomerase
MGKSLLLKVCGMINPQNIKEVDDVVKPDYIGMIFYLGSQRYMDKNPDALPDTNAKKIGVFVNASIETIIKKAREFKFNIVQLHGDETPEFCKELSELGYNIFKAFKVDDSISANDIKPYKDVCSTFIFDSRTPKHGGSGKKFNWEKLDEIANINKFFLSGGISAEDTDKILKLNYDNLIGIDINSKFEIKPGLKDVDLIKNFKTEILSKMISV